REHVFAQFGSGTLAGAATHLSHYMLLDPLAMFAEAEQLCTLTMADPFATTTIDRRVRVVTPYHRAVNRLRELARGCGRHGSCGMGIGETMADWLTYGDNVLFAEDLYHIDRMRTRLHFLRRINRAKINAIKGQLPNTTDVVDALALLYDDDEEWLLESYRAFGARTQIVPREYLHTILQRPGTVLFEAAQGVLLDEWRGFHPYTTWSTTTLANAEALLAETHYRGEITRIGITRAYATRHGTGPFVTEDAELTAALPDACNHDGVWQQGFRVGWLDLVMLRYALAVTGHLDYLAVTCLDRLAELPTARLCTHYHTGDGRIIDTIHPSPRQQDLDYQERLTNLLATCQPCYAPVEDIAQLPTRLADTLGVAVGICSYGPTAMEKQVLCKEMNWGS
ncbi:MAG: adenylosuccinate synthetase, partial [Caldilineaceae bacterium]|nr:adenylosuccinate synthetase [Caldilineaceae bacterium]